MQIHLVLIGLLGLTNALPTVKQVNADSSYPTIDATSRLAARDDPDFVPQDDPDDIRMEDGDRDWTNVKNDVEAMDLIRAHMDPEVIKGYNQGTLDYVLKTIVALERAQQTIEIAYKDTKPFDMPPDARENMAKPHKDIVGIFKIIEQTKKAAGALVGAPSNTIEVEFDTDDEPSKLVTRGGALVDDTENDIVQFVTAKENNEIRWEIRQ